MEISPTAIPEVKLVRLARHEDARGFFSETWNRAAFATAGIDLDFVQDNHALSAERGTLRGLHFQIPPFAQAKFLRCPRGAVFDVALDLRHGSPTYGRHVHTILSEEEWNAIVIPEGFAHGYCTLEPATEVFYKVNRAYAPDHDRGLLWNDPALGIDWPVDKADAILSERDRSHPTLAELPVFFRHE